MQLDKVKTTLNISRLSLQILYKLAALSELSNERQYGKMFYGHNFWIP